MSLSTDDRKEIRRSLLDGLGWEDVAAKLGFTSSHYQHGRKAVRRYYLNVSKIITRSENKSVA